MDYDLTDRQIQPVKGNVTKLIVHIIINKHAKVEGLFDNERQAVSLKHYR